LEKVKIVTGYGQGEGESASLEPVKAGTNLKLVDLRRDTIKKVKKIEKAGMAVLATG